MAYEREHTVEDTDNPTSLAELHEEDKQRLNLQKIREMTIGDKLMKLPVSYVTTAKNSPNWAITVEHPIEGELTFYADAPVNGWVPKDGNIVQILNWYNVKTEDPYQLQIMSICVEKTDSQESRAHGWELVEPPGYDAPLGRQFGRKWDKFKSLFTVPSITIFGSWIILLATSTASSVLVAYENHDIGIATLNSSIFFVCITMILLILLEDA